MKKVLFWSLMLMVVVASLLPTSYLPPPVFSIWDKLQHAIAFALLTALGCLAYEARRIQMILGLFLLGASIEIAQAATGWRFGEWLDLLADGTGIGVALALLASWTHLRTRKG